MTMISNETRTVRDVLTKLRKGDEIYAAYKFYYDQKYIAITRIENGKVYGVEQDFRQVELFFDVFTGTEIVKYKDFSSYDSDIKNGKTMNALIWSGDVVVKHQFKDGEEIEVDMNLLVNKINGRPVGCILEQFFIND